ncbi:endonuclease YncB(thermonuclease family) [Pseudomonas sp. TE3786]
MGFSQLLKKASLVGAFFVSTVCVGPVWAFCPAPSGLVSVSVTQVVDGDTLRLVDGRSVRLIGINAPELAHKGQAAQPFAEQAKRRLQELVRASDGQVAVQVGRQAKDHYGRTLAHVYAVQGQNLEAQLLAEGLGFQVAIAPNVALLACQQAAERSARAARLGVWRETPALTAAQVNVSGFALVQGRVMKVEQNRGGVWLQLDGPLVLRVASKVLPDFDLQALQDMRGRTVEARGWVIDRARRGQQQPDQVRWMLPLTHPTMVEVRP